MAFTPIDVGFIEADLRARWEAEGSPVWADGDRLTLVCERSSPHVLVWPVFQCLMQRVGEDFFALAVDVDDLESSLISYAFWEVDESGVPTSGRPPEPDGRYRGPKARPEAPSNREPLGTFTDHVVESDPLGSRAVSVYRPPDHDPFESLPVVYATDGNLAFIGYVRRLDAAIENGTCPRVVVVAAHSAGGGGTNLRALEYLPGFDPARFDGHRTFFTEELPRWAEKTFGVRSDRGGRAVFGCSDGAGHALAIAETFPEFCGSVIAYSTGMPPERTHRLSPDTTPTMHLGAGALEGPFYLASQAWAGCCELMGLDYTWTETVAGHDLIQWCENLPGDIAGSFG